MITLEQCLEIEGREVTLTLSDKLLAVTWLPLKKEISGLVIGIDESDDEDGDVDVTIKYDGMSIGIDRREIEKVEIIK